MRRFWREDSGARHLFDDVEHLCDKLERPVCSKDLAAYYHEYPHKRPEMLQALGQLLIKSTYERTRLSPTLKKIGIIRNCAYYAVNDAPAWYDALRIHGLKLRVSRQITLSLPRTAQALLYGENEALARNALRGLINEYSPALTEVGLAGWRKLSALSRLIKTAERHATPSFAAKVPTDLIERSEARNLIQAEYTARNPQFDPSGHNFNRHFTVLKWPQSTLFLDPSSLVYSEVQIRAYCAAGGPRALRSGSWAEGCGVVWRMGCHSCHRVDIRRPFAYILACLEKNEPASAWKSRWESPNDDKISRRPTKCPGEMAREGE